MPAAAEKIGFGVPDDITGTVHSVFRNALILDLDTGELVTVVPAEAGALPFGITLAEGADATFETLCATGDRAAVRGGVLRIGTEGLAIDLRSARPWRSRLGEIRAETNAQRVAVALRRVGDLLAADGRARPLARLATPQISVLAEALARRDADAAEPAAVGLIGLGEGGTPAGDDFLVGFLAGLRSLRADAQLTAFAAELAAAIAAESDRTNDVSRTYLDAAVAGEVSERLTVLARAIGGGATGEALEGAARAAIAVGHSSGADGTFGLLTGLGAV
jgi:hypothetical protein